MGQLQSPRELGLPARLDAELPEQASGPAEVRLESALDVQPQLRKQRHSLENDGLWPKSPPNLKDNVRLGFQVAVLPEE